MYAYVVCTSRGNVSMSSVQASRRSVGVGSGYYYVNGSPGADGAER
jgi:hypothetical protein